MSRDKARYRGSSLFPAPSPQSGAPPASIATAYDDLDLSCRN